MSTHSKKRIRPSLSPTATLRFRSRGSLHLQQFMLARHRFKVDAGPAGIVEMLRDGKQLRMPCTNVDIEPRLLPLEQAGEHYVLEILRIRDHEVADNSKPALGARIVNR